MGAESETFTLVEFLTETAVSDGKVYWEESSCDINGDVMVFGSVEDAAGMARFIMGCDGGDEREPRLGYAPLIGIVCEESDESGYSLGWVDLDGVLHYGDYENDPEYWAANPVREGA